MKSSTVRIIAAVAVALAVGLGAGLYLTSGSNTETSETVLPLVSPAVSPDGETDPGPALPEATPTQIAVGPVSTTQPTATPLPGEVPVGPTPTPVPAVIPTPTPVPEGGPTIVVNPGLAPAVNDAGPAVEGDGPRPVGRFSDHEGVATDLVLGELIVSTDDPAAIDGFLARHGASVVSTVASTIDPVVDYLVRVPTKTVDPAVAAANLDAAEEGHAGTYELSHDAILTLIDIAATETAQHGLEVSINWIPENLSIETGQVSEADGWDPFNSYLGEGGSYDTGVTSAWQVLNQHGRLDERVEVLVADGGFFETPDFPSDRKIRLASWGEQNPGSCGNPCPWHGTFVATTAVGQVDNGWGVAGVAGPVGALVAVQPDALDIFTEFRQIRNVVEEERPDVVNMSFSADITIFRNASQSSADRRVGEMVATGAIVFASAGNDGRNVDGRACIFGNCYENRLVIPCESKHAICVGGLKAGPWLHDGSNHGTAGGNRSVEIYAPYCVALPASLTQGGVTTGCGTSYSSPFVAGAAALMIAADPSLDRHEIKQILIDTAHDGGVHFDHYIRLEDQHRVNVLDAVLDALGVEPGAPSVTITSHNDFDEVNVTDWFELDGVGADWKGQPLPISWRSSIDGNFGTEMGPITVWELTRGTHTIIAEVTDESGIIRSDSINLVVNDNPPELEISWPQPGTTVWEGNDITLVGGSLDPDTNQFLTDANVYWELRRNGNTLVGPQQGHVVDVAAGMLTPGTYNVVFTGESDNIEGSATSSLTINELPPGHTVPKAYITSEFQDWYGSENGKPRLLTFEGFGNDLEDGAIPGTRFRWVATADNYSRVLCEGTHFGAVSEPEPPAPEDDDEDDDGPSAGIGTLVIVPPKPDPTGPTRITTLPPKPEPTPQFPGPGSFTDGKDCSSFDAELSLLPHHPVTTHYTVVLEVKDSTGYVGIDQVGITINYVTG